MTKPLNTDLPKNIDHNVHHVQQQISEKQIHQQRIYRGHNMYEVDIEDESVRIMPVEEIAVHTPGSQFGPISTKRKVVTKPNCLYISCLNLKNLKRLIDSAGGSDISSFVFKSPGKEDKLISDIIKK